MVEFIKSRKIPPKQVELGFGERGAEDDEDVAGGAAELRGVLIDLSKRFYTGGWGYGQLRLEDGGVLKITGTLEGHVAGTSLVVRGTYKTSKYGRELECTSIIVDSVSGALTVIEAWAHKWCRDHEEVVIRAIRHVREPDKRWGVLVDHEQLQELGVAEEDACAIAIAAQAYLASIKLKRALMELGFTDAEAEALYGRYKIEAVRVIEDDPYLAVLERVLAFNRIDAVVGERFRRDEPQRLRAAQVQALVGMLRDGHTAQQLYGVQKVAADIAGVYVDAIIRCGPPTQIWVQGDYWQLRRAAYQENDIARWIARAAQLEDGVSDD